MGQKLDIPTVLCVDDDETVLESLKAQLKRSLGASVLVDAASGGEEALDVVGEYLEDGVTVPLVISDEIMPGMKGHEVLRAIHALLPDTRKILLTGQADLSAVTAAVNEADLYRYIAKPWEQVDLLLTVRAALASFEQERDRRRRLQAFHSFVPEPFLRMLGVEDPVDTRLGLSDRRDLTVLFADIRGFTGLSERLGSDETFRLLNECFAVFVPQIVEEGGVVDKYIGDAVMALFEQPRGAIEAARRMVGAAPGIGGGAAGIRIGVGLNSGTLILGTVGVRERLQTTVIGDVVNTAARIEALTKPLGAGVLLSGATAASADPTTLRYVGLYTLRGRGERVPVHQLLDVLGEGERDAVEAGRDAFAALVRALDDGADVTPELADYVSAYEQDGLAGALLTRLRQEVS